MKFLSWLIILTLIIIVVFQSNKLDSFSKTIKQQSDSIRIYHPRKINMFNTLLNTHNIINLKEDLILRPNDSIYEIHRMIYSLDGGALITRVECLKDSSIRLTYKLVSFRNPITGLGKDTLYKTDGQILSKDKWTEFKNKLHNVTFYEATYWNGYLDCVGKDLNWEAAIEDKTYSYYTYCNQSPQFTEACKFLMFQAEDQEIRKLLTQQFKKSNYKY